jgi:SAM-dependent methyltransferase
LNVGAGTDVRPGWTNLDQHARHGAQVVFDLERIYAGEKLPFHDQTFDYVLCSAVLEDFVDPIPVMKELARVTKDGGVIELRVPFHTRVFMNNLAHKRGYTIGILNDYTDLGPNYDAPSPMRRVTGRYACCWARRGTFGYWYATTCCTIANLLGYTLVESTFLQYLLVNMDVVMVYQRTGTRVRTTNENDLFKIRRR